MGDLPGHEFHGNQYTAMASKAIKQVEEGRNTGAGGYISPHGGSYTKKMPESNETPHPPRVFHAEIVRQLEARGFVKTKEIKDSSMIRTVLSKTGVGTHTVDYRNLGVVPGDWSKGLRGHNEVRIQFEKERTWAANPPTRVG